MRNLICGAFLFASTTAYAGIEPVNVMCDTLERGAEYVRENNFVTAANGTMPEWKDNYNMEFFVNDNGEYVVFTYNLEYSCILARGVLFVPESEPKPGSTF